MAANRHIFTKSAAALFVTSSLVACGGGSDGGDNIPSNCLIVEQKQVCFDVKRNETKGSSFTIEPTSGDGIVRWSAPGATAIEHGNKTFFSYDAALTQSSAIIYAIDPQDENRQVEITVELEDQEQALNIYPIQFALQTSSTELNLQWLPTTTKTGRVINLATKLEVVEVGSDGNLSNPEWHDVDSQSSMNIDVQPNSNYLFTLVVDDGSKSYRSLPVSVQTSQVDYLEKPVIVITEKPDIPTQPVGTFVDFEDQLFMVAEIDNEDGSSSNAYVKAHPFQLFDGDIPEFSTVVSEIDESTIRALTDLAVSNQAIMLADETVQFEVRLEQDHIVVNNLRLPRELEYYRTLSRAENCDTQYGFTACSFVTNNTNFLPKISTVYDNGAYLARAEIGVDSSITNTLEVGGDKFSSSFDPIGISREIDIGFPKFKGLDFINKYTEGQSINIGVTVGIRGEASVTTPSIGVGMKNAVYAKMSAAAGVRFSDGLIPLPEPVFESPQARFNAHIAEPYYNDGTSYISVEESLTIEGALDFGAYATIQLLEGFEVNLDAYRRGEIQIGYTSPIDTLVGVSNPTNFMLHTTAANIDAINIIDGNVKFDWLNIDESMDPFKFGKSTMFALPDETNIAIELQSQCIKSGVYRPDPELPPEDQKVCTDDSGCMYDGDSYGSDKDQTVLPTFADVRPVVAEFINSKSSTSMSFIDKLNSTPQVTRGVYKVVKANGFTTINRAFPMIIDMRIEHSEIKHSSPWACWGESFKPHSFKFTQKHKLEDVIVELSE